MAKTDACPSEAWAFAKVTGATGASTGARGCAIARTSAGVYTVTLDRQLDTTECHIEVTPSGGVSGLGTYVDTSDSVKTVKMFSDAGAATDLDFSVAVYRFAP